MPFQKGNSYGQGRPKGSMNRATRAVKECLLEAFEKMGGMKAFVAWGKENPTEFYKLWGKIIPTEIRNADGESFKLVLVEQIVGEPEEEQPPAESVNGDGESHLMLPCPP